MKKKNSLLIPILSIVLILLVVIVVLSLVFNRDNEAVGGQTDSHGCLGPAGYSWNSSVGACIREWELDSSSRDAARIAIAPLSFPVTIIKVEVFKCVGCFDVIIQRNDNRNEFTIHLINWKPTNNNCNNYSIDSCPESCLVCPPCKECSSLKCSTKDFCESIGFNESWYNSTKPPACNYDSKTKSYIKKEPNCVINFLCTNGSKAFSDSCGCGCEKSSQELEKVYCNPTDPEGDVACPEYYSATCGWFNSSIKCFKYPCAQEFSNPCFACSNPSVEYYTAGECPK